MKLQNIAEEHNLLQPKIQASNKDNTFQKAFKQVSKALIKC